MFELRSILVPLDLSEPSADTMAVAEALAQPTHAELHILHVAAADQLNPMVNLMTASVGAAPFSAQQIHDDAAHHVDRFIREHSPRLGDRLKTAVILGGVVDEVLHYATDHHIDMIVMGTRAHGLFSRLVRGSISEAILERSTCPVLLVPHRAA